MQDKIALHGSYYPNNYGDVLILEIQSQWIKEITGREVVLPYATSVYREIIKPSDKKGIEGLKNSIKVVYGAGGYLGEPLEKKWTWGFRFLKKHIIPYKYAQFNNKKHAVIAPGVGPVTNVFAKREIVNICKRATVLTVRDQESKDFLISEGVKSEAIIVTADVALTLTKDSIPKENLEKIHNVLKDIMGEKYGIHIGVSMDSDVYGTNVRILMEEIIRFLNENQQISPVLIIDNDNSAQNKAVEYISSNLISDNFVIYRYENIWEMTALLNSLDLVVTNKLHVGIVSYTLDTKCIAFPYHPKTSRFYKQIEQSELCIPLIKLKEGIAYKLLLESTNDNWRESLNKRRSEVFPKVQREALKNKEIMQKFLLES